MTPWLVSVDPGCRATAWAAWRLGGGDEGHLVRFDHLNSPTTAKLAALVERLRDVGVEWPETHLVVEGQWLGRVRDGASPHQDVLALACQRRSWEVVAELAGASTEVVPAGWVAGMTRGAPLADDLPKGTRDSVRRLVWVARRRWPGIDATADEWAAILLGEWWLTRHRCRAAKVVHVS